MITAFRMARFVNFAKKKEHASHELDLLQQLQKSRKLYTLQRKGKQKEMVRPPGLDTDMEKVFFDNIQLKL